MGYLPSGPDELTQEELIMIGQACFGGQGGPDEPDPETIECIVAVLGYLPSGPDALRPEEMLKVAENCLGGAGILDGSN